MAFIDHSLTYKQRNLRNIVHQFRLRGILRYIAALKRDHNLDQHCSYADFGCSTGFITDKISRLLEPHVACGFDHNVDNLTAARQQYPKIKFYPIDLNSHAIIDQRFDIVTCFETLEHVGNVTSAVLTIIQSLKPGGVGLLVVPIECGKLGFLKCVAKFLYGYDLSELKDDDREVKWMAYLRSLLIGDRMSKYRNPPRPGWGTHFGFDYRDVDDALISTGCVWHRFRVGINIFYSIQV